MTRRAWWLIAALSCACEEAPAPEAPLLTREQLKDPEQCKACHPRHYDEWSSSMHAYAAEDPVFLAMNRRGQRETQGELGAFCVKCHAPLALAAGATRDGLDLEHVPRELKGVTCYYCHTASGVGEHFNNGLRLADDGRMRAAIDAPVRSPAHAAPRWPRARPAHPQPRRRACPARPSHPRDGPQRPPLRSLRPLRAR